MTTFFWGAQEDFGWRECEKKGLGERIGKGLERGSDKEENKKLRRPHG